MDVMTDIGHNVFYLYVNMCTMCACMADVDTTGGCSKRVGQRGALGNYQNV